LKTLSVEASFIASADGYFRSIAIQFAGCIVTRASVH
jgi:hypothetical protein